MPNWNYWIELNSFRSASLHLLKGFYHEQRTIYKSRQVLLLDPSFEAHPSPTEMLPVQSPVAWEGMYLRWCNVSWDRTKSTLQSVILTVLHIIAIGSTIFRLIHRFRIKKIGWDDYAAVIAVSFDISVLVQLCFKFHDKCAYQFCFNSLSVTSALVGAPKHLIESFWFSVFLLQVVLWCAPFHYMLWFLNPRFFRFSRISLLLSVARIFPSGNPVKRNCYLFSLLFILLGITCMVANTLLCRGNQTLPFYRMRPRCVVTPGGQYPNGIITVSCESQIRLL